MRLLPFAALLFGLAACRPAAPDVPAADDTGPADPSVAADSLVIEDSTLSFFVHYLYPQLRDAGPHTDALNRGFADSARAVVETFRPTEPPDPAFPYETTVDGGFEVDRLDSRLFSAVELYSYYTGGAHPNHDFIPINYDLATGRPFGLGDLFRPETPYLDTLSARTEAHLRAWAGSSGFSEEVEEAYWPDGFAPEAVNFSRFTVGSDSLHLHFPPYQLAAYAAGAFYVTVPLDVLRPFLAPSGPADALR